MDLLNGKLVYFIYETATPNGWLNMIDVNDIKSQKPLFTPTEEVKKNGIEPTYQRAVNRRKAGLGSFLWLDDESLFIRSSLTNISLNGDTLCKFGDYDQPTISREVWRDWDDSRSYRVDGLVTLQKGFNDTVFRVIPPNRLLPVYVTNWGAYKPDINEFVAAGAMKGKFILSNWIETTRFIFIHYHEGRVNAFLRLEGKVKDHWAIFDKTKKTLTHILLPGTSALIGLIPIPPLLENDIEPIGMPFYPNGVNHKGEMYMTFTKLDVKKYIDSGKFQKAKLQAIYDSMPDDSFCLMLVK